MSVEIGVVPHTTSMALAPSSAVKSLDVDISSSHMSEKSFVASRRRRSFVGGSFLRGKGPEYLTTHFNPVRLSATHD
jgi:hypothetical protein